MAIAEDASTPAVVHSAPGTGGTVTSASFSPPAGSLVAVLANCLYYASGATGLPSCADSLGNAYSAGCATPPTPWVSTGIFTFWYASAPGSITVTVTVPTTVVTRQFQLAPRVLTGAAASQAGAASLTLFNTAQAAFQSQSFTTTTAGSRVYLAVALEANAGITADANTTEIDHLFNATADAASYTGWNGPTVTPGPVSMGWGNGASFAGAASTWCGLEILPTASPGNPAVTWGTPHQLITLPNDFTGWNPAANVGKPYGL